MTWSRLRLSSIATICAVVYIVGGILAPTMALACEGAGEEKVEGSLEFLQKGELKVPETATNTYTVE